LLFALLIQHLFFGLLFFQVSFITWGSMAQRRRRMAAAAMIAMMTARATIDIITPTPHAGMFLDPLDPLAPLDPLDLLVVATLPPPIIMPLPLPLPLLLPLPAAEDADADAAEALGAALGSGVAA
jgi:hypothetical protein